MFAQLALYPIFGYPAIMYSGIGTWLLFLIVAIIGWRTFLSKSKLRNPIWWHKWLAVLALAAGFVHGFFGLSILLGF